MDAPNWTKMGREGLINKIFAMEAAINRWAEKSRLDNLTIDTLTAQNGALLTEIAILKGDMRPASVGSDA